MYVKEAVDICGNALFQAKGWPTVEQFHDQV